MNIYQKLIEVRKEVPYIQKADKGHQYNYTGSSRVLGSLKAKMDELGLLLIPKILSKEVHQTTEEKNGKQVTTYFTELTMEFTWVNAEKPEEQITVPWYAQGIDTAGEKGVGKALTYAEKYFLLKQFNIATDKDDPDAFQQKIEDSRPEPPKPKPITQQQVGQIKLMTEQLKSYGMSNEDVKNCLELEIGKFDKMTSLDTEKANKAIEFMTVWVNQNKEDEKQGA